MNEVLLSSLFGTLGGIVVGIISYFTSRHTTKQELKKIELAYRQKLDESYITNARLAVEKLYLPLNARLTELSNAFEHYYLTHQGGNQEAPKLFHQAYTSYIANIAQLFSNGEDAYLTHKLAKRLQTFNNFIKASIGAQEVVLNSQEKKSWRKAFSDWNLRAEMWRGGDKVYSGEADIDYIGRYLNFESAREILAAPITTLQFQQQFRGDMEALKLLIREVTLGTILLKTVQL